MSYANVKPTKYAGILFRSRLEARWAVFFDALGIAWEYEPETFECEYSNYTPDFRLPDIRVECHGRLWEYVSPRPAESVYVEVKPTTQAINDAGEKLYDAVEGHGPCGAGLILLGPVPFAPVGSGAPAHPILRWAKGVSLDYGAFTPSGFNPSTSFCFQWHSRHRTPLDAKFGADQITVNAPTSDAYSAARSARFDLYPAGVA